MGKPLSKLESRTVRVGAQGTITQPIAVPGFPRGIGKTIRMVLGDPRIVNGGVPFVRLTRQPSGLVTIQQRSTSTFAQNDIRTGRIENGQGSFDVDSTFSIGVQRGDNDAFNLSVTNKGKAAGLVALMGLNTKMDNVDVGKGEGFTAELKQGASISFLDRDRGEEIGQLVNRNGTEVIGHDGKRRYLTDEALRMGNQELWIRELGLFPYARGSKGACINVVNESPDRVVRAMFLNEEGVDDGTTETAEDTLANQVKVAFAKLAESLDIVFDWDASRRFTDRQWEAILRNIPEITKAFRHIGAERLAREEYVPDFEPGSTSCLMFNQGGSITKVHFDPTASSREIIQHLERNISPPKVEHKPAPKAKVEAEKPKPSAADEARALEIKAMVKELGSLLSAGRGSEEEARIAKELNRREWAKLVSAHPRSEAEAAVYRRYLDGWDPGETVFPEARRLRAEIDSAGVGITDAVEDECEAVIRELIYGPKAMRDEIRKMRGRFADDEEKIDRWLNYNKHRGKNFIPDVSRDYASVIERWKANEQQEVSKVILMKTRNDCVQYIPGQRAIEAALKAHAGTISRYLYDPLLVVRPASEPKAECTVHIVSDISEPLPRDITNPRPAFLETKYVNSQPRTAGVISPPYGEAPRLEFVRSNGLEVAPKDIITWLLWRKACEFNLPPSTELWFSGWTHDRYGINDTGPWVTSKGNVIQKKQYGFSTARDETYDNGMNGRKNLKPNDLVWPPMLTVKIAL